MHPADPAALATVLIVDDDPAIQGLLAAMLLRRGYQVLTAGSAGEGLALVAAHKPELVLMDYQLPDRDGLSMLQEIKTHHPSSYVIMATGRGNEELAVELMKAGASEYLLKPFDARLLPDRVDAVLKLREIELANQALQAEREHLLLEIETWNRELQTRVQERTEALHRAQTEIAQTEKLAALGYLAAGMAHEIRNPLNSISLFTQLLGQGVEEIEIGDYLGKILKEVDRIDGIIRKLVDAANRSRVVVDDIRLDQVVTDALDIFSPQIDARQLQVSFTCAEPVPPIKADRTELEQIFTNLLMNAVEELPQGGELSIRIDSPEGLIAVRVADNGGGIASDHLESIFKPFFSTKSRGTGIGLPVARRIARLYHGDVTVDQTSETGTTFLVTIPREQKSSRS
ncbi:response regulator [Trichlorobacter lovleyi]|uniref:hybrid sensor histidine kinase/response regulator n=1 Tax=Trichlorobacter lovleyi TaxID=313985 RepID=UPI0022407863|nr:hybrid sensor histidine kinase/response regulator [Trichlorobacter lovleyi]QOX80562.1 response regulator [Trichlorobacter lovleyi]